MFPYYSHFTVIENLVRTGTDVPLVYPNDAARYDVSIKKAASLVLMEVTRNCDITAILAICNCKMQLCYKISEKPSKET